MVCVNVIISFLCFLKFASSSVTLKHDKDTGRTPVEMIKYHGYPVEVHNIVTEDGYILDLYRIPYGKNSTKLNNTRLPLLLVHGLVSSSADYLNMGPEDSLGFLAADEDYDVWLLNCRGTTFSNKHKTIDPSKEKKQYFNFSWHQIGYYDLPSTIDYVLNNTGKEKLYYIGHSQGGTSYLVMGATRPEYNDKIQLAQLLAPAAFMSHVGPFLKTVSKHWRLIEVVIDMIQMFDFPGKSGAIIRELGAVLCANDLEDFFCAEILTYLLSDASEIDKSKIPVVLTNAPNNAASKQWLHYAQLINTGKFEYYDHGAGRNRMIYGQAKPLEYNLTQLTAPVVVFNGKNDNLVTEEDTKTLLGKLPNVVEAYTIGYEKFTHYDFLFAKDVVSMVYNEVFKNLKKH